MLNKNPQHCWQNDRAKRVDNYLISLQYKMKKKIEQNM